MPHGDASPESSSTVLTGGAGPTMTETAAAAAPLVAVIETEPNPTAVTSPSSDTAARASSPVDQDTGASGMVAPVSSVTVAESRTVSPRAESEGFAGVTEMLAATGPRGSVGLLAASPQEARPTRRARVSRSRRIDDAWVAYAGSNEVTRVGLEPTTY